MNNSSLLSDEFIDPVVDWQPLANRKYRRTELYQMAWESVNLEDQFVVAAPLGGPIAVTGNFGPSDGSTSSSTVSASASPGESFSCCADECAGVCECACVNGRVCVCVCVCVCISVCVKCLCLCLCLCVCVLQ
jgi:Vps16, N-terminal region